MARPVGRMARRVLGGLVTLVAAGAAASFSASFALESRDPALALKLDGTNPEALIGRAEAALANPGSSLDNDDMLEAARASIAVLPLNAAAFRLFASSAATSEGIERFESQVAMSDRLSRRDLATQLFLIEAAVERRDIRAALRHYDTAMRIRESSRGLLLPVLSSAIKSPEIRTELVPYFRDRAPWLGEFIRHSINNSPEPRNVVRLLDEAGGIPEGKFLDTLHAQLLSRLVNEGEFATAADYFRSIRPEAREILGSIAMTAESTDAKYTPATWQVFTIASIESMFLAAPDGGFELTSEIEPGFSGSIARRLAALPAGDYRISAPIRATDMAPGATVTFQLRCASDVVLDKSIEIRDGIPFTADFTIPAGCTTQLLTISAGIGFEPRKPVLTIGSPTLSRR